MKSTVDAAAFLAALEIAARTCEKSAIPELEQVCAEFTPGRCKLTATNLEQWIVSETPAGGDAFRLVFWDTKAVLKACKYFSGAMEIEYQGSAGIKPNFVCLSAAGKSLRQMAIDPELFPNVPEFEAEVVYRTNAKDLLERFESIQYAIKRGDAANTLPYMTGVRFEGENLVTIDGRRLAVSTDTALNIEAPFNLRGSAMKHLNIFKGQDIELAVGKCGANRFACISDAETRLYSRLLAEGGIVLGNVIPKSYVDVYTVDVGEFIKSMKYLCEFSLKGQTPVVSFERGMLSMRTTRGEYHTSLNGIEGMPSVRYGFDGRHMLEGLRQFKTAKRITVKISGPSSPIILTDGYSAIALVMPHRISDAAQAA